MAKKPQFLYDGMAIDLPPIAETGKNVAHIEAIADTAFAENLPVIAKTGQKSAGTADTCLTTLRPSDQKSADSGDIADTCLRHVRASYVDFAEEKDIADDTLYIPPPKHAGAPAPAHIGPTHKGKECPQVEHQGGIALKNEVSASTSALNDSWDAWHWVIAHTKHLTGWIRRRVRREGIAIMRSHLFHGDAPGQLREAYQRWQKTPWEHLPPDLPRYEPFEDVNDWLTRCYGAGGWSVVGNGKVVR